jgi:DNA-binding IscR family transcriptional regulator
MRAAISPTRDIWKVLGNKIQETLKNVTIAKLAETRNKKLKKYPGIINQRRNN